MPEVRDPEKLPATHQPALVKRLDGTEMFVDDHKTTHSGWLQIVGWSGSIRKIPPHRVVFVECVDVETRNDGEDPNFLSYRVVTDDELADMAREAAGLEDGETEIKEVVADD